MKAGGIVLSFVLNQADKYKYKSKYTVLFCEPHIVKTIQLRHIIPLAYIMHLTLLSPLVYLKLEVQFRLLEWD